MIDIEEIERLAKAATEGPWRVGAYPAEIVGDTHVCIDTDIGVKVLLRGNENFYEEARANATFSAAANPIAVLALIAEVRSLRADAARYQWLKPRFRTFSLDMGGQHTYCATGEIGRIRGPNLDMAIDAAIAKNTYPPLNQAHPKEGV